MIMAKVMDADPGMEVYDPCCGSGGLLIKCEIAMEEKMRLRSRDKYAPLRLYGQEYIADTWAMANMNMIIHDMEVEIEIGETFTSAPGIILFLNKTKPRASGQGFSGQRQPDLREGGPEEHHSG